MESRKNKKQTSRSNPLINQDTDDYEQMRKPLLTHHHSEADLSWSRKTPFSNHMYSSAPGTMKSISGEGQLGEQPPDMLANSPTTADFAQNVLRRARSNFQIFSSPPAEKKKFKFQLKPKNSPEKIAKLDHKSQTDHARKLLRHYEKIVNMIVNGFKYDPIFAQLLANLANTLIYAEYQSFTELYEQFERLATLHGLTRFSQQFATPENSDILSETVEDQFAILQQLLIIFRKLAYVLYRHLHLSKAHIEHVSSKSIEDLLNNLKKGYSNYQSTLNKIVSQFHNLLTLFANKLSSAGYRLSTEISKFKQPNILSGQTLSLGNLLNQLPDLNDLNETEQRLSEAMAEDRYGIAQADDFVQAYQIAIDQIERCCSTAPDSLASVMHDKLQTEIEEAKKLDVLYLEMRKDFIDTFDRPEFIVGYFLNERFDESVFKILQDIEQAIYNELNGKIAPEKLKNKLAEVASLNKDTIKKMLKIDSKSRFDLIAFENGLQAFESAKIEFSGLVSALQNNWQQVVTLLEAKKAQYLQAKEFLEHPNAILAQSFLRKHWPKLVGGVILGAGIGVGIALLTRMDARDFALLVVGCSLVAFAATLLGTYLYDRTHASEQVLDLESGSLHASSTLFSPKHKETIAETGYQTFNKFSYI